MANPLSNLLRSSFLRQVGVLISSALLTQMVPFLFAPLLTRLFVPHDFGVVALYVAIVNVGCSIVTGRYELAIVLPRSSRQAHLLLAIAIGWAFIINVLLFVLLLLGLSLIHTGLRSDAWLFLFLPLSIFLAASLQSVNCWLNRQQRYYPISVSNSAQRLLTVISSAILGVAHIKSGLLYGQVMGKVLTPIVLLKVLSEIYQKLRRDFSRKWIRRLLKRYRRFPLYSAPSSLINALSTASPIILLSLFFRQTEIGLYALSVRVLMLPVSVLSRNIGQVFLSRAQQLKLTPEVLTRQVASWSTLVALPIFGVLVLCGPVLFSWFFGAAWRVAGQYTQLMSFWLFYVFLTHPISMLLVIKEQQHKNLLFDVLLLAARLASIAIGAIWLKNMLITVALFAGLGALLWCGYAVYLFRLAQQRYRFIMAILILPLIMLCCLGMLSFLIR